MICQELSDKFCDKNGNKLVIKFVTKFVHQIPHPIGICHQIPLNSVIIKFGDKLVT